MSNGLFTSLVVLMPVLVFYVYCLVDFSRTPEREMRTFTRPAWVVLLIFGNLVGALLWLSMGRPEPPSWLPRR